MHAFTQRLAERIDQPQPESIGDSLIDTGEIMRMRRFFGGNPPDSPFGPLIAQAREEGYTHETKIMGENLAPYRGYQFKILTQQGPHAPAGEYNYIINGHMLAGFALVAWPEEWGNTGVMTFIVNQQGKIYQKNLGPETASVAGAITAYDPDSTWKPVEGD